MTLGHADDSEEFLSWREMWKRMYPVRGLTLDEDEPSGHWDAAEMNRLRGVAIVQAAETEAVLGHILRTLDVSANRARPAGPLLTVVMKQLDVQTLNRWSRQFEVIDAAIKRRNRIVHDTVQVGYSWREYATGDGGEHVPVISLLGAEDTDEWDLRNDLHLQQRATQAAIEVLHYLRHRDGESEEASYCATCVQGLQPAPASSWRS
jgi:hypothetical protein